jgi:uncharacterized protein
VAALDRDGEVAGTARGNWCAGGCAVATFRATGRFDVRLPNCNIYKTIYPEALLLEAKRVLKYAAPSTV